MRYKKWIIRFVVVLAAYYLLTRPANAADAVNSAVDGILNGADQLSVFFTRLT
jgi:hypothetical protein